MGVSTVNFHSQSKKLGYLDFTMKKQYGWITKVYPIEDFGMVSNLPLDVYKAPGFDEQFTSFNCLMRWLNMSASTLKVVIGRLNLGRQAEAKTCGGWQYVILFSFQDIALILSELIQGKKVRKNAKTKAKAKLRELIQKSGIKLDWM